MTRGPDKTEVLAAARAAVRSELEKMSRLARDAAAAAVHEDNRPESGKDMRSTESSYIAAGQAQRAVELASTEARLGAMTLADFAAGTPIAVGALIELESDEGLSRLYFLVPAGGGLQLSVQGYAVSLITTASPLGAALVGLGEGDTVEVPGSGGAKECAIDWVR